MGSQLPIYDNDFPLGSLKIDGVPVTANIGIPIQGKYIFVKPHSGLDIYDGLSPQKAVKTLARAKVLATADQNDVVVMFSESNTGTITSDLQLTNLDWNKDLVHLIGVGAGSFLGQRSRVGWSTSTSTAIATPLFTLSANSCLISNVEFISELAGGTSQPGCMNVTGMRNKVFNCQISGMANADQVIAGAYSLYLNAAAENLFERCYIGLDTIPRATDTTSEIRLANAATRNMFLDCTIATQIGHNTYSPYVYFNGADAIDRWLHFKRCSFINFSVNYAYTQSVAFLHSATPTKGVTWVEYSSAMATNWSAAGVKTYISNPLINTAYTGGTGYAS